MVNINAQIWLDKEYPTKRSTETKLTIPRNSELEGKLDLKDFINLEILECNGNKLTDLDVSMCPKLKIFSCGNNQLTSLDLSNNNKLEILICWINEIEKLDVNNLTKLKILGCSFNKISELDLRNNLELESLDIADNNFPERDLTFLSRLTNLRNLAVGNSDERKKGKYYNSFKGSLAFLKNMDKLERYSVTNLKSIDKKSLDKNWSKDKKISIHFNTRMNMQAKSVWSPIDASSIKFKGILSTIPLEIFEDRPGWTWEKMSERLSQAKAITNVNKIRKFATSELERYQLIKKEIEKKADEQIDRNLQEFPQLRQRNSELKEEKWKMLKDKIDGFAQELKDEENQLQEFIDNKINQIDKSEKKSKVENLIKGLCKAQEDLVKNRDSSAESELIGKLGKAKGKINEKYFSEEEIEKICQNQEDITKLEDNLKKLKAENIRNILLIGWTGDGKSTLGNILVGKKIFEESSGFASETKEIQIGEFEEENVIYRVIDTIGIGDNRLSEEEVLDKIAEASYYTREGINQVLFVINNRFDEKKKIAYELAKAIFSDEDSERYITIVKNVSTSSREHKMHHREESSESIKSIKNEIYEIIEGAMKKNKFIEINGQAKEVSRRELIKHLVESCQGTYDSPNLEGLSKIINPTMSEIQKLEKKLKKADKDENKEELRKALDEAKEKLRKETKTYMQERNVDWNEVVNIIASGAKVAAIVAPIVAAHSCKIM